MKRTSLLFLLLFLGLSIVAQITNPFNLGRSSNETDTPDTIQVDSVPTQEQDQSDPVAVQETEDSSFDTITSAQTGKNLNPFDLQKQRDSVKETPNVINDQVEEVSETEDSSQTPDLLDGEGKFSTLFEKLPNRVKSPLLIFWSSVISLILLAFVLTNRRGILRNIIKGLGNRFYLSTFKKEEDGGWSSGISILYLIYIINITAFIHLTLRINGWLSEYKYLYLWVLLAVMIVLIGRHIVIGVMKRISKYNSEFDLYYFMIVCVNILIGLSLIPINLLIAYGPQILEMKILFFGIGLLGITLIIKWLKGLYSSLSIIVSTSYHFLLYLCTAEILPLLVGIRLFYNLI